MANLSDTFKYISHFRHAGHQVGRKVGDMLEILTYAAIARDENILSRLQVEPKLHGFSEAGHKVEFILLKNKSLNSDGSPKILSGGVITDPSEVISFIECKRVGVEQTINSGFKKKLEKIEKLEKLENPKSFRKILNSKGYKIYYNEELNVSFGVGVKSHVYSITFHEDKVISDGKTAFDKKTLSIKKKGDVDFYIEEPLESHDRLIFALSDNNESTVITNANSLRSYEPSLKSCRILEVLSVNDMYVEVLLNDCLGGPQTPEKAKQASFVALDVRKKRFGSFDKRLEESEMISVLILTEFDHWEDKSQNMIKSCIDKNFVVKDDLIIEAFVEFEKFFGADFYNRVTKNNFEKDPDVRAIAMAIVNKYDGKIFLDIEDDIYKKFSIENDYLTFTS